MPEKESNNEEVAFDRWDHRQVKNAIPGIAKLSSKSVAHLKTVYFSAYSRTGVQKER